MNHFWLQRWLFLCSNRFVVIYDNLACFGYSATMEPGALNCEGTRDRNFPLQAHTFYTRFLLFVEGLDKGAENLSC